METITTDNELGFVVIDTDTRLRFEDGRLFIKKTTLFDDDKPSKTEKIDVTEEVLDVLLKALEKRDGYNNSTFNGELKYKY